MYNYDFFSIHPLDEILKKTAETLAITYFIHASKVALNQAVEQTQVETKIIELASKFIGDHNIQLDFSKLKIFLYANFQLSKQIQHYFREHALETPFTQAEKEFQISISELKNISFRQELLNTLAKNTNIAENVLNKAREFLGERRKSILQLLAKLKFDPELKLDFYVSSLQLQIKNIYPIKIIEDKDIEDFVKALMGLINKPTQELALTAKSTMA